MTRPLRTQLSTLFDEGEWHAVDHPPSLCRGASSRLCVNPGKRAGAGLVSDWLPLGSLRWGCGGDQRSEGRDWQRASRGDGLWEGGGDEACPRTAVPTLAPCYRGRALP